MQVISRSRSRAAQLSLALLLGCAQASTRLHQATSSNTNGTASGQSTYTAAYIEHEATSPCGNGKKTPPHVWARSTARTRALRHSPPPLPPLTHPTPSMLGVCGKQTLAANAAAYVGYAEEAASEGAGIIVFPE